MSYFRPIFLIAGNTITGILRGVVLNVLVVVAALAIVVSVFPSSVDNPADARKFMVDSGLAGITILGAVIAILTGFTMVPGEVESRTVYPVLAKPVRRWQFVLGKYLGAIGINGITVGLLSVLFFAIYLIKERGAFDTRLLVATFMIFFMTAVLSAFIIFLSTFMSWIGTIIVSMVVWLMGSYSHYLRDIGEFHSQANPLQAILWKFVSVLLPQFQAMDMRQAIVDNPELTWRIFTPAQLLPPMASGLLYAAVVLAAAILIFNYREV